MCSSDLRFRRYAALPLPPTLSLLKPSLSSPKAPSSHLPNRRQAAPIDPASPPRPTVDFVDFGDVRRLRATSCLPLTLFLPCAPFDTLFARSRASDRRGHHRPHPAAAFPNSGEELKELQDAPPPPASPLSPPRRPAAHGSKSPLPLPLFLPEHGMLRRRRRRPVRSGDPTVSATRTARCVPAETEGGGGGFCYLGMQDVEADSVAKQEVAARPGTPSIPRRSWGRRRPAAVDDARVDLGNKKVPHLVKKMRKGEMGRKGKEGGNGMAVVHRTTSFSPAAEAELRG